MPILSINKQTFNVNVEYWTVVPILILAVIGYWLDVLKTFSYILSIINMR